MNKKQKQTLIRIIVTVIIIAVLKLFNFEFNYSYLLYIIPYLIIGHDILNKAFKRIIHRQFLDENFLMTIATLGSFFLKDYFESVSVMLFYQIGELFQSYAIGKSRKNISDLMNIRPDYAYLYDETGEINKIDPSNIQIGSKILIKVGDKVPIDGIVVDGQSSLNTIALTGESKPLTVKKDDEVLSGSINMTSPIIVKTTKLYEDSTVSKILDLVENASSNKSKSENFITRFSRYYTPIVCLGALSLVIIPILINLIFHSSLLINEWIYRALTFLVISCPCALVISIPLSFFGGIGSASKYGILIKGSNYLEELAKSKYIAFDKTGTITKGVFEVSSYHDNKLSEDELLKYAAYAEAFSNHPISISIVNKYNKQIDKNEIESINEIPGKGILAKVLGKNVIVGNKNLFIENNIQVEDCIDQSTIVYIGINNEYVGHIHIADIIKNNSKICINELHNIGIKKTYMLTGDKKSIADKIGYEIGINETYSELLPIDKIKALSKIKNSIGNEVLTFIGDGINDAPVITKADIGIAMGALGSEAAIEAADIVLMDDDPYKVVTAIKISRKCMRIVYENIYFAICVKAICLILGALGITNMWLSIFADVGVMIISVLNSIRNLYSKGLKI